MQPMTTGIMHPVTAESGTVRERELRNDGSLIHLYPAESLGLWASYGVSAYRLRLFGKAEGYGSLRAYSAPFGLPCTVVGKDASASLLRSAAAVLENTDSHVCVRMAEAADMSAYARWTGKLKGTALPGEDPIPLTPVSRYVPRDRYIPDRMSSFSRNAKRVADLLLSGVALAVFSPLFLACYAAVRREDGGSAIFRQERIGRFGRPFWIYKFRSMRLDAEASGPRLSHGGGEGDPRLTKAGRFLRAHHLDELPQLWNVFKGDMSFVGPRPERKFYIDQIMERDMRYAYLYQIRPGVTSYATLHNGYTDTMEKMLRRLEYDLYYLGHRSWRLDFRILLGTFCSIVFGKKF